MMKIALLCAALALALPYAAAESGEANIPTHGDLPYIADDNPAHLLDIYLPAKAEKPAPIVVFIHGGGWMVGHKGSASLSKISGLHRLMKTLRESGYAVIAINYRLSGEAVFPAQMQDIEAAMDWIGKNADTYHIDSRRIALTGDSAGAHLAQIFAVNRGKNAIRAVLSYYGVSDIGNVNAERIAKNCPESVQELMGKLMDNPPENSPEGLLMGEDSHSSEFYRKATVASPLYHVNENTSPMMLLHGDEDCWVPHSQSLKLHAALQAAGIETQLLILEKTGRSATRFFDEDINAQALQFLQKHL